MIRPGTEPRREGGKRSPPYTSPEWSNRHLFTGAGADWGVGGGGRGWLSVKVAPGEGCSWRPRPAPDAVLIFGSSVVKRRQFEVIWRMTLCGHGGWKGAVIFSSFVQAAAAAPKCTARQGFKTWWFTGFVSWCFSCWTVVSATYLVTAWGLRIRCKREQHPHRLCYFLANGWFLVAPAGGKPSHRPCGTCGLLLIVPFPDCPPTFPAFTAHSCHHFLFDNFLHLDDTSPSSKVPAIWWLETLATHWNHLGSFKKSPCSGYSPDQLSQVGGGGPRHQEFVQLCGLSSVWPGWRISSIILFLSGFLLSLMLLWITQETTVFTCCLCPECKLPEVRGRVFSSPTPHSIWHGLSGHHTVSPSNASPAVGPLGDHWPCSEGMWLLLLLLSPSLLFLDSKIRGREVIYAWDEAERGKSSEMLGSFLLSKRFDSARKNCA